jgi:hypothetical protein
MASTQADATKLTSTAVRVRAARCVQRGVCLGQATAFRLVHRARRDVARPAVRQQDLTGPSATLTCGGCGVHNTAYGPATLRFYNGACATEIASRVNGGCNTVSGTAGAAVTQVQAATANATCTPRRADDDDRPGYAAPSAAGGVYAPCGRACKPCDDGQSAAKRGPFAAGTGDAFGVAMSFHAAVG